MAKQTLIPKPPQWFVDRKELYDTKLDAFGWFWALFFRLPEMDFGLGEQGPSNPAKAVWDNFLRMTEKAPRTWSPDLPQSFRAVGSINPAEIADAATDGQLREVVVVDLNAPDGVILAAFEAWLANARETRAPHPYKPDRRKSAAAERLGPKTRKSWRDQHILEVFDLTLWKRLIRPDLSDTILSGWIFPSPKKGETLDRLRYSRTVLSEAFDLILPLAYEIPCQRDWEK